MNKKVKIMLLCFILLLALLYLHAGAEFVEVNTYVGLNDTIGMALPQARRQLNEYGARTTGEDFKWVDQLEQGNELTIYEQLEEATGKMRYYTKSNRLSITLQQPIRIENVEACQQTTGYRQLMLVFERASHAYMKDYTDSYWYNGFSIMFSITTADPMIRTIFVCPDEYYDGIRNEISDTEAAILAVVKTAEGKSDYEKVKYFHDYLCNMITYSSDKGNPLYHSVPCAWLTNYGHLGVCEAYAKSFARMCEYSGIPAICVTGGSKRDSNGYVSSDHMWNYVQLDGKWYLVDCTWDDSSKTNTWFLKGKDTAFTDHIPVGRYSATEYVPFEMPDLAECAYEAVPLTGLSLSTNTMSLDVGQGKSVGTVTKVPSNASTWTQLEYVSDQPGIAAVSSGGYVTGVLAGTTTIHIRSKVKPSIETTLRVTVSNHVTGDWQITKSATCTTAGEQKQYCTTCGILLNTQKLQAKGHTAGNWVVTRKATCTVQGVQKLTCTVCGIVMGSQSILATGHTAGSWVITQKATCTTKGEKKKTCTICGTVLGTQNISATGHKYGTWLVLKAATCTTAGKRSRTCTLCGKNEAAAIAKTEHKAGRWIVTKEATCIVNGKKVQKCVYCNRVLKTSVIAKKKVTVSLNASVLSIQIGQSASVLKITKQDKNDRVVRWTTSDPNVVKVNAANGTIRGMRKGSAVITLIMKSGAKATCKVTVQKGTVATTSMKLAKTIGKLKVGNRFRIATIRTPLTANDKITYSSSNNKIVVVSESGIIKAISKGKATITIQTKKTKITMKITVVE